MNKRPFALRPLLIFACAACAFSGSILATLATWQARDFQLRGYVDATQSSALPFRVPRLGVNADLTQYSPSELRQQLTRMETANIRWIRQEARWDAMEPTAGDIQWGDWDRLVAILSEHPNLKIIVVFVHSPAWARHPDARDALTPSAPPEAPSTFAAFASAFARRYGEIIDHYQIWDEPNISSGWGGREPRASDYVALLQAGFTAIHAEDAASTVIAAGLAPTVETGPLNWSDDLFLREMYLNGAAPFMDAAAGKPYGFDLPPSERTVSREVLNFSRIVALREIMVEFGDGSKPLWASEWGWNSLPSTWTGTPSPWRTVDSQAQVTFTQQALDRAEREWPWMAGMILEHWQPEADVDDPRWGFSLIDPLDRPTDLYSALVQYPIMTTATNGLYPPTNPFTEYRGIWTFSDIGADVGWVNDSRLTFAFMGSDVALKLREANYVAHFYATVNGLPANALPRDPAGNSYALLTSDSLQTEISLVPIARDLPVTNHHLEIVVDELIPDEIVNRWPLVGIAVSSGNLHTPYNRQIAAAIASAAVALAALTITGREIAWNWLTAPLNRILAILGTGARLALGAVASLALMFGMLVTFGDSTPAIFRKDAVHLMLSILTGGFLLLEPGLLLSIVAVIVLFVLIVNQLDLGLLLVVFWAPFFLFPVELYRFAFPLSEVILWITVGAWVLRWLMQYSKGGYAAASSRLFQPQAVDYCVAAWVLLGGISLLWTKRLDPAITELRTFIIQPALFYALLRAVPGSVPVPQRMRLRLVDALLLAGFAVALIGLMQFARGEAIIAAESNTPRLAGVYGSPNNVGLFLGRCLPFALAFVLIPTDQRRRWAAAAAFGIMSVALIFTQSAGALFVGVPAALACVLILRYERRAWLPLALSASVLLIVIVVAVQFPRFSRLLDLNEGTNFYRIRVWQSAVNVISDHPLTGIGLDQFLYEFRGTYIMPDAWDEPTLSHPHNFFLDYWIRLGLAGVVLFIATQVVFWRRMAAWYQNRRQIAPLDLVVQIGAMGSMCNLLAHGLIDNSVYVHDLALVFVLLLVMSVREKNTSAIDETP